MRTIAALASAALATTLTQTAVPAAAAPETCRGEAATLVGTPQTRELTGTDGRDVIVTNGAYRTTALGGDDVVCVTGRNAVISGSNVWAGDGDDVVDATQLSGFGASAQLGAGADRFEGSAERDFVWGGTEDPATLQHVDTERDVISTGPPTSSVHEPDRVVSGQAGATNDDEVRMGRGTLMWAGVPGSSSVLDGGSGSALALRPAATEWVAVNNVTGTLAVDDRSLRFTGFRDFSVFAPAGTRSFTFRGSDRAESVSLEGFAATQHRLALGGGRDRVSVYTTERRTLGKGTAYIGGAGRDTLDLVLPDEADVDLHLARGRLSTGRRAAESTVRARGFEDSSVMAEDVEVVGTAGRNRLRTYACRSTVDGRGGRDTLSTFDEVMDEGLRCRGARARFSGGTGNDRLSGSRGRDRLIGGPGRDTIDGLAGRDTCQGERLERCEVRR